MTDNIIVDTATRIFADLCEPQTINAAEEGKWPQQLWDALEESGLTLTWVPDTLGGAGAEIIDGFAVLRVAGRFAAPVPLAVSMRDDESAERKEKIDCQIAFEKGPN